MYAQMSYKAFLLVICALVHLRLFGEGLPVFYWKEGNFINFGDHLALKIVERIVGSPLKFYNKRTPNQVRKLLTLGSVFYFANEGDVVWGSGVNGKRPLKKDYKFTHLDVRAVRGPLTRAFLMENFGIESPEIYGDPALLIPYLFPEFKKKANPSRDYIVIPNYMDAKHFLDNRDGHIVYSTEPWDLVIEKILDSRFVISSSLHGIVVAEAFNIPARMLRVSEIEPLIKYADYYLSTARPDFQFATSVKEALTLGGEAPGRCDLKRLYEAFPFEFWPHALFPKLNL
jgi:pyruvyltransferase